MLLMEGAMALMLIHGDPSYIDAAARAGKRLVRQGDAVRSSVREISGLLLAQPNAAFARSRFKTPILLENVLAEGNKRRIAFKFSATVRTWKKRYIMPCNASYRGSLLFMSSSILVPIL